MIPPKYRVPQSLTVGTVALQLKVENVYRPKLGHEPLLRKVSPVLMMLLVDGGGQEQSPHHSFHCDPPFLS